MLTFSRLRLRTGNHLQKNTLHRGPLCSPSSPSLSLSHCVQITLWARSTTSSNPLVSQKHLSVWFSSPWWETQVFSHSISLIKQAEAVTCIKLGYRIHIDLVVAITLGSCMQIALCLTPLFVILGWIVDVPMSLSACILDDY